MPKKKMDICLGVILITGLLPELIILKLFCEYQNNPLYNDKKKIKLSEI